MELFDLNFGPLGPNKPTTGVQFLEKISTFKMGISKGREYHQNTTNCLIMQEMLIKKPFILIWSQFDIFWNLIPKLLFKKQKKHKFSKWEMVGWLELALALALA